MADDTCVRKVNGEPEAQQIKAFLEANEVPCALRGEALRMTHGFTLDGLGVVRICVAEANVERALSLLALVDAGELALEPDQDVESD
jgi:hypothetical protein